MSIQEAYNDWASTYDTDRNLTRDLDQRVTRDALAGGHFHAILELGCGTGKNTPLLAQRGERVLALDFSSGMIARAQAKVHAANVRFATADITIPWPCASRAMDLIVCSLILEHIADLSFIFAEAARVLTEGGQLLICELHPFRQYEGKKAVFQREGGQTEIPAFVHHISDFLTAAAKSGLTLATLGEWWHDEDQGKPPRLVSFRFTKPAG
jgi:ubiquinone/menaquinone biosynthesis C-methylase UbiE